MIRSATPADHTDVARLLREAGLPTDGAFTPACRLWVLPGTSPNDVAGAVGLERHEDSFLLRSLVIDPILRGRGEGGRLLAHALGQARAAGARRVYCLTTTIAPWLARLGWQEVSRDDLPRALEASAELRGACPASAACLVVDLTQGSHED